MWQLMQPFEIEYGVFFEKTSTPYARGCWEMKKWFDEESLECVLALRDMICMGDVSNKWKRGTKTFLWTSWYDFTKVILDWNGAENTFRLRHSASNDTGGIILPWTDMKRFDETANAWYKQRTGRDWCQEMYEQTTIWDEEDLETLVHRKEMMACWRSIFSWQSHLRSRYIIQVPLHMSCVKEGRNVVIVGSAVRLEAGTSFNDGEKDEMAQRKRDRKDNARTCVQKTRLSKEMFLCIMLLPLILPAVVLYALGWVIFNVWTFRKFRIRIDLNEVGLTHL